jgi:hypothetical protein
VGGLTPTTNTTAPIRHPLPDFFKELLGRRSSAIRQHDTSRLSRSTSSSAPDELYLAPRTWAKRAYPDNLILFNELDRGGHFAAWEQPQLLSEEVRAGFRPLRK